MRSEAPRPGPRDHPVDAQIARPSGGPPRILLIDAAKERRHGLRLLLEDSRMTVFETASGTEALALAGIVRPDVAVIDLRVPDRDGFALAAELRRHVRGLTVLVQSTADRASLLPAARRAGALDVLEAGGKPAAVVEAIREAVSIGRTTAEVAARTAGGARSG